MVYETIMMANEDCSLVGGGGWKLPSPGVIKSNSSVNVYLTNKPAICSRSCSEDGYSFV